MSPWLTMTLWTAAAAALLTSLYGLHRLALRLEARGHLYYWHKQPTTSASRMWTPLQEAVEPQIRHVVEAEEHHQADEDDREGGPERPAARRGRRSPL